MKDCHNSMLIHVTRYVDVQNQLAIKVQDYQDELKHSILGNDQSTLSQFKEDWSDYIKTTEIYNYTYEHDSRDIGRWDDILLELKIFANLLKPVKKIFGDSKDSLEYKQYKEGLNVICIGGDKLSRGLTLSGLTVSFFSRAASTYDTLMQMARWFGYRDGYEDLCRMYAPCSLRRRFEDITFADYDLTNQFIEMADSKTYSPSDYGLRILNSNEGMKITRASAMRFAKKIKQSYSDRDFSLAAYSRNDEVRKSNFNITEKFISSLGEHKIGFYANAQKKGLFWDTKSEALIEYLENFRDYYENSSFVTGSPKTMIEYINRQNQKELLINWRIGIHCHSKNIYNESFAGIDDIFLQLRSFKEVEDQSLYQIRRDQLSGDEDMKFFLANDHGELKGKNARLLIRNKIKKEVNGLLVLYFIHGGDNNVQIGHHYSIPSLYGEVVQDVTIPESTLRQMNLSFYD